MDLKKLSKTELGKLLTIISDEIVKDEIRHELLTRSLDDKKTKNETVSDDDIETHENTETKADVDTEVDEKTETHVENKTDTEPDGDVDYDACESLMYDDCALYKYFYKIIVENNSTFELPLTYLHLYKYNTKTHRYIHITSVSYSNNAVRKTFESGYILNLIKEVDDLIEINEEEYNHLLYAKNKDEYKHLLCEKNKEEEPNKKVIYPKGTTLIAVEKLFSGTYITVDIVKLLSDVYDINKHCNCSVLTIQLGTKSDGTIEFLTQAVSKNKKIKLDDSYLKIDSKAFDESFDICLNCLIDILNNANVKFNDKKNNIKKYHVFDKYDKNIDNLNDNTNNVSKTQNINVTYKNKNLFDDMFNNIDVYIKYYNELFKKLSKF